MVPYEVRNRGAVSLRKSLRTRVTPVTSMLLVSLFSMFHCSVKSSTVLSRVLDAGSGDGRTPWHWNPALTGMPLQWPQS